MKRDARTLGAIDLAEEAVYLVRRAPWALLGAYYAGSLPFVLGLLYFWADMSHSAFAYNRCAGSALGLALLFVWMKTWQAMYARGLLAFVQGETHSRWTASRLLKTLITQTAIQAWGVVAFPAAFLAILPVPWLYAFYQNVSVFGDGDGETKAVVRRAWEQAKVWPRQNALLIWLLSPMLLVAAAALMLVLLPMTASFTDGWTEATFNLYVFLFSLAIIPLSPLGVMVAMNLMVLTITIPQLAETFLGIETVFARNQASLTNTTVVAVVCAMAYLLMDPVVKAAYALRCFYGESLRTGADLKAALRSAAAAAEAHAKNLPGVVLLAAVILLAGAAHGDDRGVTPSPEAGSVAPRELDEAIERVIHQREYSWRMPRPEPPEEEKGVLSYFLSDVDKMLTRAAEKVRGWIESVLDWIHDHLRGRARSSSRRLGVVNWLGTLHGLTVALVSLAGCALAVLVIRTVRQRRKLEPAVKAEAIVTPQALVEESLTADAMPEDRWLAMAHELMGQGEFRLALRALFLGTLAFLGRAELVTIRMFKSNRDYQRELERRAHAYPSLPGAFGANVLLFESAWYGNHEVTRTMLSEFSHNHDTIRRGAGSDEAPRPGNLPG